MKVSGVVEVFSVFFPLFLSVICIFCFSKNKVGWFSDLKFALVLSFALFALVAGSNWGYLGRMSLACGPLLSALFLVRLHALGDIELVVGNSGRLFFGRDGYVYGCAFLVYLAMFYFNAPLLQSNISTALNGGYHQGFYLPGYFFTRLHDKFSNVTSFGITPENYKITGVAVDRLRVYLGMENIKFMAPDVGGLGLCCARINVIDSALLTNRYLAKNGYRYFGHYLEMVVPDVIQTHGIWSEVSSIYGHKFFRDNYKPIIIDGNLMWVYSGILQRILTKGGAVTCLEYSAIPLGTRYFTADRVDVDYLKDVYRGLVYKIDIPKML